MVNIQLNQTILTISKLSNPSTKYSCSHSAIQHYLISHGIMHRLENPKRSWAISDFKFTTMHPVYRETDIGPNYPLWNLLKLFLQSLFHINAWWRKKWESKIYSTHHNLMCALNLSKCFVGPRRFGKPQTVKEPTAEDAPTPYTEGVNEPRPSVIVALRDD